MPKLKAIGVREVFNAEATTQDLIDGIERIVAEYGRDRTRREAAAHARDRRRSRRPGRRAYDPAYRPPRRRAVLGSRARDDVGGRAQRASSSQKIQGVMAWAWERAPFYRTRWQRRRARARRRADRSTTSRACRRSPRPTCAPIRPRTRRSARICASNRSEIARMHGTSGTSGRPTAFALERATITSASPKRTRASCGASACGRATRCSSARSSRSTSGRGARSRASNGSARRRSRSAPASRA